MDKSYGEISKHNVQDSDTNVEKSSSKLGSRNHQKSGVPSTVAVRHVLPKDEIISDTFQRTINTHDVKGMYVLD